MPMLTQQELADFRRENGAEFYHHQKVMEQRRQRLQGAEDAAPTPVLSPSANIIMGALLRELRPRLAADASLNLGLALRGVNAKNLKSNKARIIADINRQCGHKIAYGGLDKLGPLIDALLMERSLTAADAGTLDRFGHDTEENPGNQPTMPSERGTSSAASMAQPVGEAIDEVDEEGMSPKSQYAPGNTGKNASGETRIRLTREGEEGLTSTEVNKIVNDECNKMRAQWAKDYGLDPRQMARHEGYDTYPGEHHESLGMAKSLGGDEPNSFKGMPLRGGGMAGDRSLGRHIESLDPMPRQRPRGEEHGPTSQVFQTCGAAAIDIWNG